MTLPKMKIEKYEKSFVKNNTKFFHFDWMIEWLHLLGMGKLSCLFKVLNKTKRKATR